MWNCITQSNAAIVCQEMYDEINSDLINSYAWDTALLFIEKSGSIENYANFVGDYTLRETGNGNDEQCKINDLAENVIEITTESYAYYMDKGYGIRGAYWDRIFIHLWTMSESTCK